MDGSAHVAALQCGSLKSSGCTDDTSTGQTNVQSLSLVTRLYIGTIIVLGSIIVLGIGLGLLENTTNAHIASLPQFVACMFCAAIASGLKVRLPGIDGTMSVNFLFILAAIAGLSSREAIWVAVVSILVQSLWYSQKRPTPIQTAFNIASVGISTFAAAVVYHASAVRQLGLEDGILLLLTGSIYFVCNTLTIAVVVALTERKPIGETWRTSYFWSYPYYLVGAALVFAMRLITTAIGWQTGFVILPVVYAIYRSYRMYLDRFAREKQHASEMAALHLRTIEALALAIDAKDHTTNEHLHRVQVYALGIAQKLGFSTSDMRALEAASLLHDIGKLAVPEHIISKPGKLTAEEFEKMKIHPAVGAEILERVKFPYPVVPIVAAHHEKWDGTGYPQGLAGEAIPVGARVLAVVDCLDALASDRQYRRALPLEEALSIVKAQSGTAFDPRVIDVLDRSIGELEARVRATPTEGTKLSTATKCVTGGAAPGAGLAEDEPLPETQNSPRERGGFLDSIVAARNEVQILFELSQSLGTSLSLVDTLSVLAQRLQSIVPHDALAIYLQRDGRLKPEYVTGQDAALFASLAIPVGQGLSGWVMETGTPVVNGNPSVEPGYLQDVTKFSTLQSAVVVPLDGVSERIGTLAVYRRPVQGFNNDHLRILLAISGKLGRSIENSLRFRQVEDHSMTDFLTGLPNGRAMFRHVDKEMQRCRVIDEALTVLVCDLDGFKHVNDSYGHLEGNRLLRLTADALSQNCRTGDYVARMGGDEFVIVMPGTSIESARHLVERIQQSVAEVSRVNLGKVVFTISVGAAELSAHCLRPEDLLGAADRQMYLAKRSRKSVIGFADLPAGLAATNIQTI